MEEWEIIEKIISEGNRDAFALIVEKYKVRIFNFIYRMVSNYEDAEDLSQEVFIRVYYSLGSFKKNFKFSHWIFKIALNICYDFLKKKKKIKKAEKKYFEERKIESENEILDFLAEKIKELPEKYRVVIILKYMQGFSYEEISEILGISRNLVKIRIYRAKEKLYNELKEILLRERD